MRQVKGIPYTKMKLFLVDDPKLEHPLEDKLRLDRYAVFPGDTLLMYQEWKTKRLEVEFLNVSHKSIKLQCDSSSSMGELKNRIEIQTKIPSNQQICVYNNHIIQGDSITLSQFNIYPGKILQIYVTWTNGQIKVKFQKQSFSVICNSSTLICELKEKIKDSEYHIPTSDQELRYKELLLADNKSLADYIILCDSEIYLTTVDL